jgi:DNA-binding CsgD family transcriptional regulator
MIAPSRMPSLDLTTALRDAPAIGVLDSCGVAYLAFTADASCVHVSPSAADLIASRDMDRLWQHLRDAFRMLGPDANATVFQVLPPWGPIALRHNWTVTSRATLRLVTLHPVASAPHDAAARRLRSPDTQSSSSLTSRELQIARLIADGESTKRIAAAMGISCHTARHHTERIFAKLAVRSRAAVASIVSSWN